MSISIYSSILGDLEEAVEKHSNNIKKLRRVVLRAKKGLSSRDDVLRGLKGTKMLRMKIATIIGKILEINELDISRLSEDEIESLIHVSDLVHALVSFTIVVSVEEERDILRKLQVLSKSAGYMFSSSDEKLFENEIKALEEFEDLLSKVENVLETRIKLWTRSLSEATRMRIMNSLSF